MVPVNRVDECVSSLLHGFIGTCSMGLSLLLNGLAMRVEVEADSQVSGKKKPARHDSVRVFERGAGEMNRTPDLLITNELLYRLSYTGNPRIIARCGSP
jgi:hypothetical protein